jgi:hypothetical protein
MTTNPNNADYHASSAIGSSIIKTMEQHTPLHAWAKYINPERVPSEPSAQQILGSVIHSAMLEPAVFDDEYTVLPDGIDRRTNAGKALFADILATGKTPVKQVEWEIAMSCMAACEAHPFMQKIRTLSPKFEQSFFFERMGFQCKIRPDIEIAPCGAYPNGAIVDLKTTVDASPAGFPKQMWNLLMHVQASFYKRAYRIKYGTIAEPEFFWFAQEKTAPFANKVYRCTDEMEYEGNVIVARQLDILRECFETGVWQGYGHDVQDAEFPSWAYAKLENELEITTEEE